MKKNTFKAAVKRIAAMELKNLAALALAMLALALVPLSFNPGGYYIDFTGVPAVWALFLLGPFYAMEVIIFQTLGIIFLYGTGTMFARELCSIAYGIAFVLTIKATFRLMKPLLSMVVSSFVGALANAALFMGVVLPKAALASGMTPEVICPEDLVQLTLSYIPWYAVTFIIGSLFAGSQYLKERDRRKRR